MKERKKERKKERNRERERKHGSFSYIFFVKIYKLAV